MNMTMIFWFACHTISSGKYNWQVPQKTLLFSQRHGTSIINVKKHIIITIPHYIASSPTDVRYKTTNTPQIRQKNTSGTCKTVKMANPKFTILIFGGKFTFWSTGRPKSWIPARAQWLKRAFYSMAIHVWWIRTDIYADMHMSTYVCQV